MEVAYDATAHKTMAARYATSFTAFARLQRLEAERLNLQTQLCEFAAVRLQRWYRSLYWRRWILPQQLLRVRVLLYSCMTIQSAWRQALQWRRYDRPSQKAATEWRGSESHSIISPTIVSTTAKLQHRISEHGRGHNAVIDVRTSLNPEFAKLAALWIGYKVRRAFASRNVQGKIQLRHDLYLLISDVEGRSHTCPKSPLPQRLAPWVDVLYSGLARLQGEVLSELDVLISGEQSLWSSPRCGMTWRGWSRDLVRLPTLGFNPVCNEPSLLATTAYQICTPPESPETNTAEEKLTIETSAAVLFDEWLQEHPSASSAGTHLTTPSPPVSSTSDSPRIQKKTYVPPSAQDWTKVKPRVRCWSSQHSAPSNSRQTAINQVQAPPQNLRPSLSAPGFYDVRRRSNESLANDDSECGSLASALDNFKGATSSCSDPNSPFYDTDSCTSNPSPFMLKVAAAAGCGGDNPEAAWEWPTLSGHTSDAISGFSRVRPGDIGSDPED